MTLLQQYPDAALSALAKSRLHFVHVPTPGDHYSPATGSAVITIIHDLAKAHAAQNLPSSIIVAKGTTDGYPPYLTGCLLQADLPLGLPSKPKRMADAALAHLLLNRPFSASLYANLPAVLPYHFEGTLFLHNAPAAIPLIRKGLPHAQLVLYAHNQLFNTYSPREIRHILDRSDAVICVSQFIADDLAARAGVQSSKIKTVLNGIDVDMFHPSTVAPSPASPLILFLGRTVPEKGPDLLLKAAAQIASPSRPFTVRIVGSSNFNPKAPLSAYEQSLRSLANHPNLVERVSFLPTLPRTAVLAQYHQASIFVAPSNWDEPFGLTIAEALACGLPTITSNRGGIPELAADAALYFAPPNTTQLATQLLQLIQDPVMRQELSYKARARALEFAWPARHAELLRAVTYL